jgi:hypothetical protein
MELSFEGIGLKTNKKVQLEDWPTFWKQFKPFSEVGSASWKNCEPTLISYHALFERHAFVVFGLFRGYKWFGFHVVKKLVYRY